MKAPVVKTFNDKEIDQLIEVANPLIKQYIQALKNALWRQEDVTRQAIKKIRELSKERKK